MNLDRIVTICTIIGALVILYGGVFIVGIIRGKNTQKKEKYLLYISYIMSISILTYCMLTLNNYGYSQLNGRIIWFASMIILLCVLPFWIKNLHIIIMIIHKKFSNMIFNIEKTELVFSLMSFVLELIFLTISFSSGKIISMLTRPTDKSFGNNELIMCLLGWIIILLSILWIYNIIKYILLSTNENNSQENKLKNVFIYKTNKIEVELNSDTHKTYSDVIIFIRINIIKRLFSKAEKRIFIHLL